MNSIQSIGIIGFGKFTQLMLTVFAETLPGVTVKVSSRSNVPDNKTFFDFAETCACDIVVPCVPISAFEDTIIKMKPFLRPGNLVIDVCSVKMHPKRVLLEQLTDSHQIICTHPNFGPESYRLNGNSTRNLNFIIESVRCEEELFLQIISYLKVLEVRIIEMSAEEHDKTIGVPHFISMYIGQVLSQLGISRTEFGAASTQRMFDMIEGVGKDFQILKDMYTFNPYCKDTLKRIKASVMATL